MDNEVLSWAAPFVVMPDHVHLLLTPGEITVSERSDLSRAASHIGLRRNSGVATGFIDHRVRDREDFEVRGEYIH